MSRIIITPQNTKKIAPHQYQVDLNRSFVGQQLQLNSFTTQHLIRNFSQQEQQFQVQLQNGTIFSVSVNQYLTASQFVEHWNTVSLTLKIESIAAPSYEYRHRFQFKINDVVQLCSLLGPGWSRIGFDLDSQFRTIHQAARVYDYVGPKLLHISINGLSRNMNQNSSTFQIPVTAAFGSVIQYQNYDHESVQTYSSDHEFELSQLIISFYDELDRPIQCVNDQQLNFCMILTLHRHL